MLLLAQDPARLSIMVLPMCMQPLLLATLNAEVEAMLFLGSFLWHDHSRGELPRDASVTGSESGYSREAWNAYYVRPPSQ